MPRCGTKASPTHGESIQLTAEIETRYALVHTIPSGIGAVYESHTANKRAGGRL
mgnify:CR=1 FL=1